MSVSFLILMAIAIPAILVSVLLPAALLCDRVNTMSETLPEGLKMALGIDRKYRFSAWDPLLFALILWSAFAPKPTQEIILIVCAAALALHAAVRMRAYLKARHDYSKELTAGVRKGLLIIGVLWGALSFTFAFLAAAFVRAQ